MSPGDVIVTAGKTVPVASPTNPRREAIKAVRQIIRDPLSTDDQVEDALEALVELSKE